MFWVKKYSTRELNFRNLAKKRRKNASCWSARVHRLVCIHALPPWARRGHAFSTRYMLSARSWPSTAVLRGGRVISIRTNMVASRLCEMFWKGYFFSLCQYLHDSSVTNIQTYIHTCMHTHIVCLSVCVCVCMCMCMSKCADTLLEMMVASHTYISCVPKCVYVSGCMCVVLAACVRVCA